MRIGLQSGQVGYSPFAHWSKLEVNAVMLQVVKVFGMYAQVFWLDQSSIPSNFFLEKVFNLSMKALCFRFSSS